MWCGVRQQKSRFPGMFFLLNPSDGLEPSTPPTMKCAGIAVAKPFPCNLAYSGAKPHLPRRPLSRPQNAGTCPQNPSPTAARPSRWSRASRSA
jgi:hypothetical protein